MSLNNRQSLRNTLVNFHVEELRFENQPEEIIDLIYKREIYCDLILLSHCQLSIASFVF